VRTCPNNILFIYNIVTLYNCHHHTRSHVTTHNNNKNVKLIITHHNNNCTVILELLAVIILYTSRCAMPTLSVPPLQWTIVLRSLFIVPVFDLIILNSANQRQHVHKVVPRYNRHVDVVEFL